MKQSILYIVGISVFWSASICAQGTANTPASAPDSEPNSAPEATVPTLPKSVARPSVSRLCSPENPLIGQAFDCTVTVEHTDAFSVNIGVPAGWGSEPQAPAAANQNGEGLVTVRRLSKTSLSMCKIKVFGFSVSWTHVSGAKGQISIPDEFVAMRSMMADVDEPIFRDFRAPNPDFDTFWSRHGIIPLVETNWILIGVLTILFLAALGALIMTYIQRRLARLREAERPWVDPRPAHVIAEAELVHLSEQNLPEQGEVLAFYLRLSEILRKYLENRFGLAVARGLDEQGAEKGLRFPAATSEEIEAALRYNKELTPEGFKTLLECLSLIDYVVFGGIRPHVGQTEADRRRVRFCVELTKAIETVEAQTESMVSATPAAAQSNSDSDDDSQSPSSEEPPELPDSPKSAKSAEPQAVSESSDDAAEATSLATSTEEDER